MRKGTAEFKLEAMTQADLAIEELIKEGKKVTVQEIHELTGITKPTLYTYPNVLRHTRKNTKRRTSKTQTPSPEPTFQPKELIEHTVESYTAYIKENYFFSPEIIDVVRFDFDRNIENFHLLVFTQAINKLQAEGILTHTIDPNRYVIEQNSTARLSELKPSMSLAQTTSTQAPSQENTVIKPADFATPRAEHINAPDPIEQPLQIIQQQIPSHLMEYKIPLMNENTLYLSHQSNLSSEDAEDVIDYLELIIKRFKRKYFK